MCCLTRSLGYLRLTPTSLLAAIVLLLAVTALFSRPVDAVEAEWIMYQDPLLPKAACERRFVPGL